MPKPKLAVILDGGLVQCVVSDTPDAFTHVDACIIDYMGKVDLEPDPEDVISIDQGDGTDAKAVVRWDSVYKADITIPDRILRDHEYVATHGTICPYCQSNDIEGGAIEVDNKDAVQDIKCLACDNSWRDIYKLTSQNPCDHEHQKTIYGRASANAWEPSS